MFNTERRALVRAITLVALSGVAVGVAALIIVIGVMDGAEQELFGKVIEIYPHVKVQARDGGEITKTDGQLAGILAAIDELPGVRAAAPVVSKQALMTSGVGRRSELVAGLIFAVEPGDSADLFPLSREGGKSISFDLAPNEIVLGADLAEELGVEAGGEVLAIMDLVARSANRRPGSSKFRVAGIFDTGYFAFDSVSAFISKAAADRVFNLGGAADFIYIKLDDPFAAERFARRLDLKLAAEFEVRSWEAEQGAFFESIKIQKAALFLILMLIVLVAGLNIIGTLILMVIEKTSEIGIIKAFGGSNALIRRTFLYAGGIIGVLGTGIGLALGITGCLILKYVIVLDMPPSVYNFEHLPVVIKPLTVAVIVISSIAVCLLSSLFPAISASRLDPVEALRHE